MVDLDFDNIWVFTSVTVTLWIIIFTVIEVVFTNGSIQSGIIEGFPGGIAFALAYKAYQRFSD